MSEFSDYLATLADYNAFHLANRAECASPDSPASAGAEFLLSVRDGVAELLSDLDADDIDALVLGNLDDDGALSQIADDAPNVYTHTLWSEFTDLAAYNEDPTELGADGSDMEQSARVCLHIIAERLVNVLVDEAKDAVMADVAAADEVV